MTESTKKNIFMILGIAQVLYMLLILCSTLLGVIGLISLVGGNELLRQYDVPGVEMPSVVLTIVSLGIGFLSSVMYLISAYGFFSMKKWQPLVFTVVVVLTLISIVANILTLGFSALSLISVFFFALWVALLLFTWANKSMFTK